MSSTESSLLETLQSSIRGLHIGGDVSAGRDFTTHIDIHVGDSINTSFKGSETKELENTFAFQVPDPPIGFEERTQTLENILKVTQDNKLASGISTSASCTTVICGGPGTGKTTLAALFIKKYGKDFVHQVWISAENVNAIRDQFINLGENLFNLQFFQDDKKDEKKIADCVYRKLCRSPTLIVFDNAESATDELGLKQGIANFLPSHVHHSLLQPTILVTTRIKAMEAWTVEPSHILEITAFGESECLQYFIRKLPLLESFKSECCTLARFFDGLPVAISTVTTIMIRDAEYTHGEYSPKELVRKLTDEHAGITLDGSAKTVYSKLYCLWDDLMEKVEKLPGNGGKAIRLLNVLSVLSSTGIPVQFLSATIRSYPEEELPEADLFQLLILLQKFSFVNINEDRDVVFIHVLTQSYLRSSLERSNQIGEILEGCAKTLLETTHVLSYKTKYYPQNLKNFAIFSNNCTTYLRDNYDLNFRLVEKIAPYQPQEAIHQIEKIAEVEWLKDRPVILLKRAKLLAKCYYTLGLYKDSLKNFSLAYEFQVQTLGENHNNTLKAKHNMAHCYSDLGMREKALEMNQEVYDVEVQVLGENHPNTLNTKHNMANYYSYLGKLEKALKMYEEVYAARVEILGENHPATSSTKHSIASLYSVLGKNEKAIEMYQELYDFRVQTLGENHPKVLKIKGNMALCYADLGKKEKALEMNQQVFKIEVQTLGVNHPETLTTQYNMAKCYSALGKKEKALEIYEEVNDFRVKVLGEHHPKTLATKHEIARSYSDLGKTEKALEIFQQVYEMAVVVLGENHPKTMTTRRNMANCYLALRKKGKALEMNQEENNVRVETMVENHSEMIKTKEKSDSSNKLCSIL